MTRLIIKKQREDKEMTDVQVAETEKRVRRSAEIVEEDYDALPDATRAGRTSQLRLKIQKVKDDNTGKHRLIARYHSSASASSAATAQRKEFAGQGFKFIVRPLDGEFQGMTGLFVIWNEAWVGADDAPKPRKRKAVESVEGVEAPANPAEATAENAVARRGRK